MKCGKLYKLIYLVTIDYIISRIDGKVFTKVRIFVECRTYPKVHPGDGIPLIYRCKFVKMLDHNNYHK